jgi:hypothetical protein
VEWLSSIWGEEDGLFVGFWARSVCTPEKNNRQSIGRTAGIGEIMGSTFSKRRSEVKGEDGEDGRWEMGDGRWEMGDASVNRSRVVIVRALNILEYFIVPYLLCLLIV